MSEKFTNYPFHQLVDIQLDTINDVDIVAKHLSTIWEGSFSPAPSFKKRRESLRNIVCRMANYKDFDDFCRQIEPWRTDEADLSSLADERTWLLEISNYMQDIALYSPDSMTGDVAYLFSASEDTIEEYTFEDDDAAEAMINNALDDNLPLKEVPEWQYLLKHFVVTTIEVTVSDINKYGVEKCDANRAIIDDLKEIGFVNDSYFKTSAYCVHPDQLISMKSGDDGGRKLRLKLERR